MKRDKVSSERFSSYSDQLAFAMRDTHCEFSLGLGTVLECVAVAEREGYIPDIPEKWWDEVNAGFRGGYGHVT